MKKQTNANSAGGEGFPQYAKRLSSILWVLACFIILFAGGGNALAQDQPPPDLKVTIAQFDASAYPEIILYVNVTDNDGNHVTDLSQTDFVVKEDDELVEVGSFAGIGEQRPVDIVYVFDTTGSMGDEITGVIQTSIAFADELESKGRDYRLGLVTFSDQVRDVFSSDGSLTDNAELFKIWVSGLKAEGGDEDPENDYAGILKALQMQFRDEAQKIIILITDAPPHHFGDPMDGGQSFDDQRLEYQPVLDALIEKNVTVYAVTPAIDEFTSLASQTGGDFYDIANNPDFTGVIEEIGETIANQYRLTYRSPRPTYDGTRRDVTVSIGESDVTTAYHERHLLNVESNCLVGLLCLLPLMAALVIPLSAQVLIRRMKSTPDRQQKDDIRIPESVEPQVERDEIAPAPEVEMVAIEMDRTDETSKCSNCGNELRPQARFCPKCGHTVTPAVLPTELAPPSSDFILEYCPYCGHKLRPGVKFCNACGKKL